MPLLVTGSGLFDWSEEDLKMLSNIDIMMAADGKLEWSVWCVCV